MIGLFSVIYGISLFFSVLAIGNKSDMGHYFAPML